MGLSCWIVDRPILCLMLFAIGAAVSIFLLHFLRPRPKIWIDVRPLIFCLFRSGNFLNIRRWNHLGAISRFLKALNFIEIQVAVDVAFHGVQ